MRVSELIDQRTHVKQLEDYLYGEEVGGYEVRYVFPPPFPLFAEDPDLREVRARVEFSTDSLAVQAWQKRIPELRQRLGPPTKCSEAVRTFVHARSVVWVRDRGEVVYSVSRERTLPEEQRNRVVVLMLRQTPRPDSAADTSGQYETVPCPK